MADKFKVYVKDMQSPQQVNISQFLGVDYYSPQLSIADFRAMDMSNFCYRDGAIQVRKGYRQIFDLKELDTTLGNNKLNGVYKLEVDGEQWLVLHMGTSLYAFKSLKKSDIFVGANYPTGEMLTDENYNAFEIANNRSYGFTKGNKIYIVDGTKYRVLYRENGVFKLQDVDSWDKTYIPTTTIGIMSQETNIARAMLDDVNLMTPLRKNKIRTGNGNKVDTNGKTFTYELDSNIINKSGVDAYKDVNLVISQFIANGGN